MKGAKNAAIPAAMKVVADAERCIRCGSCAILAPGVFAVVRRVQIVPLEQVAGEAQALADSDQATKEFFKDLPSLRTPIVVRPGELRQAPPLEQLRTESRAAIARQAPAYAGLDYEKIGPLGADLEARRP